MSSGVTSVLGLHTYDTLDDFDFSEVTADNNKIDLIPVTRCTSGTRPTTDRFQGRMIYETDTGRFYQYDLPSTSWVLIADPGLVGAAWTDYASTWGSNGTAPTLGNGTIDAKQKTIGNLVFYRIRLTIGSTTTLGTGTFTFTLPENPANGSGSAVGHAIVTSGAGAGYARGVFCNGGTSIVLVDPSSTRVSGSSPIALTSGCTIDIEGCYEKA